MLCNPPMQLPVSARDVVSPPEKEPASDTRPPRDEPPLTTLVTTLAPTAYDDILPSSETFYEPGNDTVFLSPFAASGNTASVQLGDWQIRHVDLHSGYATFFDQMFDRMYPRDQCRDIGPRSGDYHGQVNIPLILHYTQCCDNRTLWDWRHRAMEQTWKRLFEKKPDWRLQFWSDTNMHLFMWKVVPKHPEIAWFSKVWEQLPTKIQKIDAVRYAWLYVYGGIYADMDVDFKADPKRLFPGADLLLPQISPKHTYDEAKGKYGPHVGNWLMASTAHHPFWIHMMRHIKNESGHLERRPNRKIRNPQSEFRVLRTTGPHGLGTALMTWNQPYQDLGMALLCRFGQFFQMSSTAVWKKDKWQANKRPLELPPSDQEMDAAIAGFPQAAAPEEVKSSKKSVVKRPARSRVSKIVKAERF